MKAAVNLKARANAKAKMAEDAPRSVESVKFQPNSSRLSVLKKYGYLKILLRLRILLEPQLQVLQVLRPLTLIQA